MIPEGNGRNYSACLALSRCRFANTFINQPFSADSVLPDPNFRYISPEIPCDYVLISYKEKNPTSFPYDENVKLQFKSLSKRSYENSQASQKISCHQYADQYFSEYVLDSELNVHYELLDRWPLDFKLKLEQINDGVDFVPEHEKFPRNYEDLVHYAWLFEKKNHFFKDISKRDEIMKFVIPEYKQVLSKMKEKKGMITKDTATAVQENLSSEKIENPVSELFTKMNMVICMSILLCGTSFCSSKEDNDLIKSLSILVSTNGIVATDHLFGKEDFTTSLRLQWQDDVLNENYVHIYKVRRRLTLLTQQLFFMFQESHQNCFQFFLRIETLVLVDS
jgi:hypothetical protein